MSSFRRGPYTRPDLGSTYLNYYDARPPNYNGHYTAKAVAAPAAPAAGAQPKERPTRKPADIQPVEEVTCCC